MRAEIIRLQRRLGVTTFYVTHDQVEALYGDILVCAILDKARVPMSTSTMRVNPDAIRKLLDELKANRQGPKSAWATTEKRHACVVIRFFFADRRPD